MRNCLSLYYQRKFTLAIKCDVQEHEQSISKVTTNIYVLRPSAGCCNPLSTVAHIWWVDVIMECHYQQLAAPQKRQRKMLDGLFTRIEVPKYIINFLSCVHVGTIIEFISNWYSSCSLIILGLLITFISF